VVTYYERAIELNSLHLATRDLALSLTLTLTLVHKFIDERDPVKGEVNLPRAKCLNTWITYVLDLKTSV